MERVGILESFEVKELIKKRKQFEYKVNRAGHNKKKVTSITILTCKDIAIAILDFSLLLPI